MGRHFDSQIGDLILVVINEAGEVQGVGALTESLSCTPQAKHWVLEQLRRLEAAGHITYTPSNGGRGHRSIIRKRNPNSPGLPRRTPRR